MGTHYVIYDNGVYKLETVSDEEGFTIRQETMTPPHLPLTLPGRCIGTIALKDVAGAAELWAHLGIWLEKQKRRGKL